MPKYIFKIQSLAKVVLPIEGIDPPIVDMLTCDLYADTLNIAEELADKIFEEWSKVAPKILGPYNRTYVVEIADRNQ